jgi:hypothetical protein
MADKLPRDLATHETASGPKESREGIPGHECAEPPHLTRPLRPPGRRGETAAPVIAAATLFAMVLTVPGILADPDTLWQIATGDWILRHRAIPHVDPFSYTFAGRRWIAHEWLAETLMSLANQAGGARGVMVLTAAASGLTAGLLLFHLRRFMAAPVAVMVLVLGVANCAGSLLARPHVLAWPCLEIWFAGLVVARARGQRPSWWLLPVMTLWVNLHGSFMIGLLLPLAFALEAAIEAGPGWRKPALDWMLFIAAAWGAALLNPDGVAALLFPFQLLAMPNLDWIGEWTPADFSALRPLELAILVLLGAGLSGRLTVPPVRLILLLGLIHMALRHWRHAPVLGLIGPLLLAEAIGRLAPPEPRPASRLIRTGLPAMAAALAAVALVARFQVPLDREPGAEVLAALDRVPAPLRGHHVLNDYGFGAYLIAHGDRPFIDSRADMYGGTFLGRFREITEPRPAALDAALRDFDVAWTIFPPNSRVVLSLDGWPGWRRLITTDAAVVHARETASEP